MLRIPVGIHLHAINPNIHIGRVYGMRKVYEEDVTYPENPLFYEFGDDLRSIWVQIIVIIVQRRALRGK